MYVLLVFLALTSVSTHDINVGSSTEGKKVFDEHLQASPAVWRQVQNITINTTDDEVISRIVVTDLREDKDGDAKIVDGGEGQKKVTIELKSPTVLRGYDFNVEVYAVPNKEFQNPRNGPIHLSEFKSNAGSLNTPNPGSKITPQSSVDLTTKLPDTPKTQTNPINTEAIQSNPRETRDTEAKNPEGNRPKVEPSSVFGQKSATTAKPNSNVPVNIANIQISEDSEDDEETRKNPTLKTNEDELRHVRDAHTDNTMTKNPSKLASFDTKTTATTYTPSYNLNNPVDHRYHPVSVGAIEGQKDERKNVNPSVVSSQQNPTVYTPNFNGNFPSLINSDKGKPSDESRIPTDQKRSARDTQAEAKEMNSPKIEGLGIPEIASKRFENITKDEERKPRSAQEGPKITPLNVDIKEVKSTAVPTILTDKNFETTDRQSSVKPPGVLTKSQNYPVPYPYEATTKAGSTTKSPFKRDTESQDIKNVDKNVKLSPKTFGTFETSTKIASTTKSPVKRDTETSEAFKTVDKNLNLNPKTIGTSESSTKVLSTTKSPVKRDTGSSEEPKDDVRNEKLNPKSLGSFESTSKVTSTTKSPVKRDTESSEESKESSKGTKIDDKNFKLSPKSFGAFESTTNIASTAKSTHKRDVEESKNDDESFRVIPKAIGSQTKNATSHDHKVPVVSLQ